MPDAKPWEKYAAAAESSGPAPWEKYAKKPGIVGSTLSGIGEEMNPVSMVTGARDLVNGAIADVADLFSPSAGADARKYLGLEGQPNTLQKLGIDSSATQAKIGQALKDGRYLDAARHVVGLIPMIGQHVDELGDEAGAAKTPEELAHVVGQSIGFGLANTLPDHPATKAVLKKAVVQVQPVLDAANAKMRQARELAQRRGITNLDAATATQNKAVAAVQMAADHSPGGAAIAAHARHGYEADMTRVLGELADETHPAPTNPVEAGAGTRDAVNRSLAADQAAQTQALRTEAADLASEVHPTPVDRVEAGAGARGKVEENIGERHVEADSEYTRLWEREQDPANVERVQVGTKTTTNANGAKLTEPVFEEMGLPVDLRAVRKKIKPVYDQLTRGMNITKRRASDGLVALENIMNARDFEPASIVDRDLSAIKAAARGADLPELKSLSQGLAAFAVKELDEQVRGAVAKAKTFDNSAEAAAAAAQPAPAAPEPRTPAAPAAVVGKATPSTGAETSVTVPDGKGTKYKARYEVRELADVQTSHNGANFEPNTKYELKNERNYSKGENQDKVVTNSTEEVFDPTYHITDNGDALNGPIVIDSRGNALGGNGRGMMLQRVYSAGKEAAAKYRGLLESRLDRFGIDPKTVEGMRQPVLVRVLDDAELAAPGAKAKAIGDFNVKGTAELTPAEQSIRDSRRVSPATLEDIAGRIHAGGAEATLAKTIDGAAGLEILQKLIDDGVINGTTERAALATKDGLTPAGKQRVSSLMLGRYFKDPAQLETIAPSVRAKVERIAAPLATVEGSAAWNLSPHMQGALDLLEQARTAGGTLEDYIRQGGLLIEQEHGPQAVALAKQLQHATPNEITAGVRQYADAMHYADQYEGPGLFGDLPEPKSPREAFNEAFGAKIDEASFEKPAEKARPKFANFDEADMSQPAPKRPTKSTGAEATGELERGRAATVKKYEAADVLKAMREEPGQAFEQLIYSGDSNIEHLNRVAKQLTPEHLDKVARAVIDDIFKPALKDGGFDGAAAIKAKWERIGDRTKRMLFNDPAKLAKIDSFMSLAKAAGEAEPGILSKISKTAEGRAIFDKLTSGKDLNIDLLHEVKRVAPAELPKMGRALLEDFLDRATKKGGFDKLQGIGAQWEKLGPQTKALLFGNPALVADLDSFFLLAQKAAERVNPSGTTATLSTLHGLGWVVMHPVTGVPVALAAAAVAKLLHSKVGVRALTEGFKIAPGKGVASTLAANRILKLAGDAARPAAAVAAQGTTNTTDPPSKESAQQ